MVDNYTVQPSEIRSDREVTIRFDCKAEFRFGDTHSMPIVHFVGEGGHED